MLLYVSTHSGMAEGLRKRRVIKIYIRPKNSSVPGHFNCSDPPCPCAKRSWAGLSNSLPPCLPDKTKNHPELEWFLVDWAGNGSRTRILTLARLHNSRYTIPACGELLRETGMLWIVQIASILSEISVFCNSLWGRMDQNQFCTQ